MNLPKFSNKQLLINLSITALIPLIHWVYGASRDSENALISNQWKGAIILIILGLGMLGAIRELMDLRHVIKGELGWFFLTLLAAAGHIILYMSAMNFFGFDFEGDISGKENTLLIIGGLSFSFFFLFELIFILANETRRDRYQKRSFAWSDLLLSLYAAFASVYIWDILLGHLQFEYQNPGYFLLAELLPAILLFLMLILPFKRYDLMEGHALSKSRQDKLYLYLSYILMIGVALAPKFQHLFH